MYFSIQQQFTHNYNSLKHVHVYIDHEQKPKSENVCNKYGFVFTEIKNTQRETSLGIQHGSYV